MTTPDAPIEIVAIGEALWDLELDHAGAVLERTLGGAPLNFAYHCARLEHRSAIVTRVGADSDGDQIRWAAERAGLSATNIQVDPTRPTGTARIPPKGTGPDFVIARDVAWDHITWDDALHELTGHCRALCFGSLAQRSPVSRATIQRAVATARGALIVFDVNLRPPDAALEIVERSLHAATWAKLNDAELAELATGLGLTASGDRDRLAELRRRYSLDLVALTRGARGCLVQSSAVEIDLPGIPVHVADTVGAGDAFTAGLVACTLEGRPLHEAVRFANALAAYVATQPGATPAYTRVQIDVPGAHGAPPHR